MKMTREERLNAGWLECWVVKAPRQGTWSTGADPKAGGIWTNRRTEAFEFTTQRDAFDWIVKNDAVFRNSEDVVIVRRQRRKKPAAPPTLKVGDEVLVRGKVSGILEAGRIHVETEPSHYVYVFLGTDVVRAAK